MRAFDLHRRWMMRGYAIGLGAGTQVFTLLAGAAFCSHAHRSQSSDAYGGQLGDQPGISRMVYPPRSKGPASYSAGAVVGSEFKTV